MRIFTDLAAWQQARLTLATTSTLGFVPTMGNLHQGHSSLFAQSLQDNHLTAVSIFVNPLQFNDPSDYQHYPRTLADDLALLEKQHVDYVLVPKASELYPEHLHYQLAEHKLSLDMEGMYRPQHFEGVLTVVMKLLHLVKPNHVYFGEKDYQQCMLVQHMLEAFFMDIDMTICPTVREACGLPFSSRNRRLSAPQRHLAAQFAQIFQQPLPIDAIKHQLEDLNIKIDYLVDKASRRFVAVWIDEVRLIDNRLL